MNDTPPTRQAIAAQNRSGKLTVSGKLKVAVDLMLYEGASRPEAAAKAGMTNHGLRDALKRVHVKQYYNHGLEVLRTSERARNIKRLAQIRDAADNMPAVQAIKTLEMMDEEAEKRPVGVQSLPGLVIQLNVATPPAAPPPTIDVTPKRD
jgi:hypothetical protein